MNTPTLLFLLPLFFLVHELEEILMACPWIKKNSTAMRRRFPKFGPVIRKMKQMTTQKFAAIATEEFLIVSTCTFVSAWTGNPAAWYCCLTAFGIHLIVHVAQFIAWRRYIPAIASTTLCLPYCIWAIHETSQIFPLNKQLFYAVLGTLLGSLNLIAMHIIMHRQPQS